MGQLLTRKPKALLAPHTAQAQTQRHVVYHIEPGQQRMLLKHHAAIRTGIHHGLTAPFNASGRRRGKPRNAIEQRSLAAARSADGNHKLSGLDRQIQLVQSQGLRIARRCALIAHRQALHGQTCITGRCSSITARHGAPSCR